MKIKAFFCLGYSLITGILCAQTIDDLIATNIPLVVINTDDQPIVDEPKITAHLEIISNGPGALNHPGDSGNVYSGFCGIEYRGTYSQLLPQKPFGLETRDSLGNNRNVSVLGMPEENDWILLANFNDKTFMRNMLAFHLFEKLGHYAPRTQLCEVIVNDQYEGIYIFTEKIKRDKNRVDIAKLDTDDNAGDSLTGGYIFMVDYFDEYNSWLSNFSPIDHVGWPVYFVYNYPDPETITDIQKNYLQQFVNAWETVLYSNDFNDLQEGYRAYINVNSFIDYFIIGEFSRNVDAYKKSVYFFKDRDDRGGLLNRGPVWDFDWSFKNMNDNCSIFADTSCGGWAYLVNQCNNWPVAPAWIVRLMQDSSFRQDVNKRYFELRKTLLSETYLYNYIDSLKNLVSDAQERHYQRWPILGINVGTPEVDEQPLTYEGEIIKFKNWLHKRLIWLDSNMPGGGDLFSGSHVPFRSLLRIFPNPVREVLYIESDQLIYRIDILDYSGDPVLVMKPGSSYTIQADLSHLDPGIYLARIWLCNGEIRTDRIVVE